MSMDDAAGQADHRRSWELIPWQVNGRIDAADRAWLEGHLAGCADCRDELAFQQRLHAGMTAGAAEPHSPEPALARLRARIDRHADDGLFMPGADAPSPAGRRVPGWTRLLAAAVVLQAVALGLLLAQRHGAPPPEYTTLTRAPTANPPAVIRLVPAPTVQLAQLRRLLAQHRLRIVDTGADGVYFGLAPQPGAALSVDAALAGLRADPAVLLAEPVAAAADGR